MLEKKIKRWFFAIVITIGALSLLGISLAENTSELFIAELYGRVEVKKKGSAEFITAKKGMSLSVGDEVKTAEDSYCEIAFDKDLLTLVAVKEKSDLTIAAATKDAATDRKEIILDLQTGSVMAKVEKLATEDSLFQIETPTAVTGVAGTSFEVRVSK